ncbi:MAG: hypothetical protein Q8M20_09970 [Rhodocyclaceae bacterium]|nr:hypothetical protein [Rhodocyclaceae bacterium]MDZ4213568.1 hypothetical protein [Rhodocyclaceae bacterium]
MSRSLLVDSALILALILIGIVGYKLSPLLMPKADVTVAPEAGCDLHKTPCRAMLPSGGRLTLSLTPRPIPVAQPIEMAVSVEGMSTDSVQIDFAGVDMAMGFNRPTLKAAGSGQFVGPTTLPVCVTGHMTWQATVLLQTGSQRIAVPFRFVTG